MNEAATPPVDSSATDTGASGTPAQPAPVAQPQPTPQAATPQPAPQGQPYKIPDAYKDKPWAAKIKSEDDLFKQIDNLDRLAGKKQVAPDFKKATPAEIEQYYAQTRPESKDAYQFGENTDPALKTAVSESMFKHGITAHQANAVIKDFQAAEVKGMESLFSADGMNAELQKAFGDEWKEVGGQTAKILKANLSVDDVAMMDKLPNPFLGLIYRMANNLIKGYGITETGAHTTAGTGKTAPTDIGKVRDALRTEIAGLANKPHTTEEKQKLIDDLNKTYEKRSA